MAEPPCLMRNIARRPIELHFQGLVTVLSPDATVEIVEMTPEIAWLEQTGALTRHVAHSAAVPAAPGPKLAPKLAGTVKRKSPAKTAGKAKTEHGVPS